MNGAISDLDQTLFSDVESVVNSKGEVVANDPKSVHQVLIAEFSKRFGKKMGIAGTPDAVGEVYDMMHFTGDGLMADWRMHDSRWGEFRIGLDSAVESLSKQAGAYWVPGGYKTQVYTRYLTEGKTIRIEPSATAKGKSMTIDGYDPAKVPDGITVQYGNTRDLSKMYSDVPLVVDRLGALGSMLENHYHASHQRNRMKQAKYTNREVNTALVHTTNLEVDFGQLILEGKDGARKHFVKKLFSRFENQLPPELDSLDEIQRIIEVNQKIELNKIIGAIKNPSDRPTTWTEQWRNYQPRNIEDVETKLFYYKKEVEEAKETLRNLQGVAKLDVNDPEVKARIAAFAEDLFLRKSRAVSRLGAVNLAQKLFRDLFTRQGYSRTYRLVSQDPSVQGSTRLAMRRLIAERVADLHVAMVFIDDHRLIQDIIDQAPAETKPALKRLRTIAHAQRADLINRRGAVDQITRQQLAEGDVVLRQLLKSLGLPGSERDAILKTRNVPGTVRFQSFADPEWSARTMMSRMHEAMVDRYQQGQRLNSDTVVKSMGDSAKDFVAETYVYNMREAKQFYLKTLPAMFELNTKMELGYFGKEYLGSFLDIGTVDSGAKIAAAYAMGKPQAMNQEIRDAIIGGIPIGGQIFNFVKNAKDWQNQGRIFPLAMQITMKGLSLSPQTAGLASPLGAAVALYSIGNTIYEVGWYFYGQPTQSQVVSLVLTGDRNAVPLAAGTSILTRFRNSGAQTFLKENAMLDLLMGKKNPPPDLPKEWREKMLKSFFLVDANRSAWNELTPEEYENVVDYGYHGKHSDWHSARDRVLHNKYYRHWKYWFQRMWFYHAVHLDFFAYGDRFGTGGKDWMRIDDTPPPKISQGRTKSQMLAEFGDAYTRRPNGTGYWDHERVFLRLYFQKKLWEWESRWDNAAPIDRNEFYDKANTLGGSWKKAVVDELIRYYLEGEAFYRATPQGIDELAGLDGPQKKAAQTYSNALKGLDKKLVNKIQEEKGSKARERLQLLESLYWHPSNEAELEKGLSAAVAKVPEYQPKEAKLTVRVPRPVARPGETPLIQIGIVGDTTSLPDPDDFKIQVTYKKKSEVKGKRPTGVLRDDVLTLLGENVEDEDLLVVEHEATIEVTSSDSSLRLTESLPVFWIDTRDKLDSEEVGLGGDDDVDKSELTGLVEELKTLARQASGEATGANEPCITANRALQEAAAGRAKAGGEIAKLAGAFADLKKQIQSIEESLKTAEQQSKDLYALAEKLAELRTQIGDEATAVCQAAAAMKKSTTRADRDKQFAVAKARYQNANNLFGEAKTLFGEIQKGAEKVRAIGPAIEKASAAMAEFGNRIQNAQSILNRAESLFDLAANSKLSVENHQRVTTALKAKGMAFLADARKKLKESTSLTDDEKKLLRDELDAQTALLVSAEKRISACANKIGETLSKSEDKRAETRDALAELVAEWDAFREQWSGPNDKGLDDALKNISATVDVADLFWESIRDLHGKAEQCHAFAEKENLLPLLRAVPNLISLTAAKAKALVEGAGFAPAFAGGDPAPSKDLEFHVQSQSPAPGDMLEPGKAISVKIHGKHSAMAVVPNIAGLDAKAARAAISQAGLTSAFAGGDPAPRENLAYHVQSQSPAAGIQVAPGSSVSIKIYSAAGIAVPSIAGMDAKAAKQLLDNAGLSVHFAAGDPAPNGENEFKVASQSPSPGTRVKKGSPVTATIYGKHSAMVSKTPDKPKPTTTSTPPTPNPAPSADGEKEFYVVFFSCLPDNLGEIVDGVPQPSLTEENELAPKGASVKKMSSDSGTIVFGKKRNKAIATLRSVDPSRVRYAKAEDSILLFHFKGEAGSMLSPHSFSKGKKYSAPCRIQMNFSGKAADLKGALLLVSGGAFRTWEELLRVYPGAVKKASMGELSSGSKSAMLTFEVTDHREKKFKTKVTEKHDFFIFSGSLIPGWSIRMKDENLELIANFATNICAAENAYHGHPEKGAANLALMREFRDDVLAETRAGEKVIDLYYGNFSPAVLQLMSDQPRVRPLVRGALDWFSGGYSKYKIYRERLNKVQSLIHSTRHNESK